MLEGDESHGKSIGQRRRVRRTGEEAAVVEKLCSLKGYRAEVRKPFLKGPDSKYC